MKKIFLSFGLTVLILTIVFVIAPVHTSIDYVPYNICTIAPLSWNDVNMYHKNIKMTKWEYWKIYSIINKLEEIEEIEDDEDEDLMKAKDQLFYDILMSEMDPSCIDSDQIEKDRMELERIRAEKEREPSNLSKIKIIEPFIDARYVIHFSRFRKIKRIVLGGNRRIIMLNDKFYSISIDDYKILLFYFSEALDDPIDTYGTFGYQE